MSKKIIALDLDGTLLNKESQLTPRTIKTIKAVQGKGHKVIIATGRPYRMSKSIYQQLQLDTPMINFNGSLTHLPEKKWRGEQNIRLDKKYLLEFLHKKEEFQADFIAGEYKNNFYITQDYLENFQPALMGVETISKANLMQADRIQSDPNSILMQTRIPEKYELAEAIRQHFKHEIEVNTWGGPLNILETCAKGVSKATALSYLLDQFGATPQDLIAFGDEHNDVEMLQLAEVGYAMKNASPTLLPHADKTTELSNQEEGVAYELEKLFL